MSDAELRALVEDGKLCPSDLVWQQGMLDWLAASKVKGLFSQDVPPPLPSGEGSFRLRKHFGRVPAWVWYAALPSVALVITASVILFMTLSGSSPRQRLLGTWEGFEKGHKTILVFSSDGTMETPSIDTQTNREEMSFLRRLRYKWNNDHEFVLVHTEASAIRFNAHFPDARKAAQTGDEVIRFQVDFPSKDEMIITHPHGPKIVFQRVS